MPKAKPSVSLRLSVDEAELVEAEFRNAIECGAQDPAFERVLRKVQAELARCRAVSGQQENGNG